jgi:hypothetical protein
MVLPEAGIPTSPQLTPPPPSSGVQREIEPDEKPKTGIPVPTQPQPPEVPASQEIQHPPSAIHQPQPAPALNLPTLPQDLPQPAAAPAPAEVVPQNPATPAQESQSSPSIQKRKDPAEFVDITARPARFHPPSPPSQPIEPIVQRRQSFRQDDQAPIPVPADSQEDPSILSSEDEILDPDLGDSSSLTDINPNNQSPSIKQDPVEIIARSIEPLGTEYSPQNDQQSFPRTLPVEQLETSEIVIDQAPVIQAKQQSPEAIRIDPKIADIDSDNPSISSVSPVIQPEQTLDYPSPPSSTPATTGSLDVNSDLSALQPLVQADHFLQPSLLSPTSQNPLIPLPITTDNQAVGSRSPLQPVSKPESRSVSQPPSQPSLSQPVIQPAPANTPSDEPLSTATKYPAKTPQEMEDWASIDELVQAFSDPSAPNQPTPPSPPSSHRETTQNNYTIKNTTLGSQARLEPPPSTPDQWGSLEDLMDRLSQESSQPPPQAEPTQATTTIQASFETRDPDFPPLTFKKPPATRSIPQIQKAEESESVQIVSESVSAEQGGASEGDLDSQIDGLAQEIYYLLRNRLSIERERQGPNYRTRLG